ncbi:MAG: UDP-3-O-(3-hydroxymyristoyl)glucosamine N-acyltransferase [Cryomorphaceae bacterium]|jgi:UDP-3-O-[3-hydroxymyristoyl] glucosamine N-acyltransferase|nr:UDP-3-O-(3-hydroxymyristoyl)glucosamine N-acyltransferase [Cryomorphaceae bacterium]MDG1889497.1 UDP-3-O-(3-hydroxymyristoyl)glucosamine N-acyltransferase [Flavobacteriaceae bacterium]MBT3503596.1 UDP-3-O-(3-hydroxymyristoyl)glucosamine N-acyltransferase [Cryomorphaceae bacterium]MBT4293122.1 UDP-3-O-(3-hydroxymyristoyl)glucosamine N-acyltransferase [Cryomorphaceae bacterium]MBT4518213.1 UDP-3-O-(3-hydroxymyristoyl)glucosamine N-acyltransferase [Cryomorphaceae bacterium]|tara:strand:+ start:34 stop:1041 length:1008 start_codon:yes stop_codon:yes gene_type:complete
MNFTTGQIADQINGTVIGNRDAVITSISKIEEGSKGSLTFLANPKYTEYIYSTNASAAIVSNDFKPTEKIQITLIKVKDPYSSFTTILELFNKNQSDRKGISDLTVIDKSSKISDSAFIGSFSTVGKNSIIADNCIIENQVFIGDNVKIGEGSMIYPGVKILDDTKIGKNCIIHSSCSIGSDGFGFAPNDDGSYKKIPQTGNVIIGDNVEIGSNSTIDRATLGSTIISNGVKLDNQIQIAHNVEIGENTAIAAQSGIAGSTKIGKNCMIGGQVGIIGHLKIGDNVKIQAQAGVTSDVESNARITGTPAISYMNYNKSYVHFKNLPEIVKKIDKKD